MEPVPLYISFSKYLGSEFLSWTPEARKLSFEKKSGHNMNEEIHNMLEAMITLNVSNIAWDDSTIFEKVVWALNGYVPNMTVMEVPPSYFLAYAVTVMRAINSSEPFSEEVEKYIAGVFLEEGIVYALPPLGFIQKYLNSFVSNELIDAVKLEWNKIKITNLSEFIPNSDNPISAQMSKLAVIQLYLDRKETLIKEELK